MASFSREYHDILAPRRAEISNFMWASRQIMPQIAYKQPMKPSPQYHKDEVLKSPKIQELLSKLSQEQNIPKHVLETQVKNILDEIGYNKKLKVIRWLGLVLVKICTKVCSGIYVHKDSILTLKSQMGDCPVILVPSHRSYADFILMSLVCFSEDIAIPAIAAGMDFHGMWGMGSMLRDTGAFFMRRSYNDDSLYWTTFKQYVYQIVTKGELPIEFFIEGTRSRSNKSLMPKYGLILMILKAFFLSQVPDIIFVPINISYDRILEEKLFAFELLGIPKPKETTSGFFRSLSIVKEKFGSIYFNYAKPISAKRFFGPNLDRSVHSLQPIHQQEITEEEKKIIPALAHEIVYQQQKHCVITPFNLMAVILHHNITNGDDLLGLEDLIHEIVWLKAVSETLGAFIHMDDPYKSVLDSFMVHKNIIVLNSNGKVTLVWDKIVLDKNRTNNLKGHELSEKTITFSVPFIMLQIYINPILHYFIDVGILVVILKHKRLNQEELFGNYHFLRSLLSQEFVTSSTKEKLEFEAGVQRALELDLIRLSGFYELGENKKFQEVLCSCLNSFIFSYFTVCSVLCEIPGKIIDEKTVLSRVQEEIEIKIHDNSGFIDPYSLNLDTISICLNTLSSQKVLIKARNKNSILYEIDNVEVQSMKNRIQQYMGPAQTLKKKLESVHLHLSNKL